MKYPFLLLLLISGLFLVSAQYEDATLDKSINYALEVGNATACNITSITYPDKTSNLLNIAMEQNGYTFNTTINKGNFTQTGETCINLLCYSPYATPSNSGGSKCWNVTPIGKDLTSAKATTYFLIFIFSLLLFALVFSLGIYLPATNNKDEMTGYILYVSNLKYLKYLLLFLSYLIALFISFFIWVVSRAYLDLDFMTNIFRAISIFMIAFTLPLFILYVYLNITNLIRDTKIADSLTRGLRVNG